MRPYQANVIAVAILALVARQGLSQETPAPSDSPSKTLEIVRDKPLLRYGQRAPRASSYDEAALQIGMFKPELKRMGSGNVNHVFSGTLVFGTAEIQVVIKPDQGLYNETIRSDIPRSKDNRSADAAYQLSRFIDLIDTPAHIIRDDAPIPALADDLKRSEKFTTSARGGAGIQIFVSDSVEPDRKIEGQVRTSPDLLDELEEIAVFDCLIGNTDRHGRNWRFREKPPAGNRHIIAIDHSLAFPTRDGRGFGNYNLIEMYLDSSRKGVISPGNLTKLQQLAPLRPRIDKILRLNLERTEIDLMWRRLEQMQFEKKVFLP